MLRTAPPDERPLTNLPPVERTTFVGREAELQAIGEVLAEGHPLLTVVGPPGMGKTRLARRVAADRLPAYDGGVWFCDLSPARAPDAVLSVVAGVVGAPLARGRQVDAAAQLGRALAARGPSLLVLDGVEHLVADLAGILATWLAEAPLAQFLVTSLVRLGVEGETCFELPPLAPVDAVALYVDRARRARGDLVAPEESEVAQLVARLDHLPLAIELAAARAPVLSPRQLLARIDRRLDLLRGPRPGRHGSLASAIACSWELLSPAERTALMQCAVFRGSFSLETAEAVVDLSAHRDAPPALDVVESLRCRSLLRRDATHPDRLSLYESVRDFAERHLVRTGGLVAAIRRHRACYLGLGEALAARVPGPGGVTALRELDLERPNLVAAFQSALEEAPAEAVRLGLALAPLAARRGPAAFEAELLDRTVGAARTAGELRLIGQALRARAGTFVKHGFALEARRDIDEGLRLAEATGDEGLEAQLLAVSGRLSSIQGDIARGRTELGRAIDIFRRLGRRHAEAEALGHLGAVEENAGRLEVAGPLFATALELFRAEGDLRFEGICVLNLGVVRSGEGRQEDARALFSEAHAILERAEDRAGVADALVNLGSVLVVIGELDRAERHLEEALGLEQACGNRWFEGLALGDLGLAALQRGDLRTARQRFQRALAIFEACQERRFHAVVRSFFAAAEAALGLLDEARRDFSAARSVFEALGDRGHLATLAILEGYLELAEARLAAGRLDVGGADRLVEAARRRLDAAAPEGSHLSELAVARRILERALAEREGPARAGSPPASSPQDLEALIVASDACWFDPPGGGRVDISRRGPLRLVLQALVEQRLLAPGTGLDPSQVFAAGWPGERALPTAAANRVYAAIRALRAFGLGELLRRHDDGYLLDPAVRVLRAHAER